MFVNILYLLSGLVLLYLGAEYLVRSSSSLAARFRLSPLLIGLTVVAFGTSAPELLVSLQSALGNMSAISVGNVVGSNMFNVAVILGLSAIIHPLRTNSKLTRIDVPVMVLVSVLFWLMFRDQSISRMDGLILFALLVIYIVFSYSIERPNTSAASQVLYGHMFLEIVLMLISLAGLTWGASLFVKGAVYIASAWGWSQAIIGITIVAAGTSLPELATSAVAAMRKKTDIAIGNIVGSNIFNILAVLGLSALIKPIHAQHFPQRDIYVMLFFSLLLLPFIRTRFELQRWEGAVLLTGYICYILIILLY